jgi:hypothetical protein
MLYGACAYKLLHNKSSNSTAAAAAIAHCGCDALAHQIDLNGVNLRGERTARETITVDNYSPNSQLLSR